MITELCANRVRSVGNVFKELGIDGIRRFELSDPQFTEALKIVKVCGKSTPALLGINAAVAYMLTSKGEEFWRSFSEFTINKCRELDIIDLVTEFTRFNNSFNLRNKLKRLSKLRNCPELFRAIFEHDLLKYWNTLAKCLNVGKESKTVVFSVKMIYYGFRALEVYIELPNEAPIPVDRRVSLLTASSGIISLNGCSLLYSKSIRDLRKDGEFLMRKSKLVRKAWEMVSRTSQIPPLHLDSLIWVIGKYSFLGGRKEIFKSLSESVIGEIINYGLLKSLINEIYYRLPP